MCAGLVVVHSVSALMHKEGLEELASGLCGVFLDSYDGSEADRILWVRREWVEDDGAAGERERGGTGCISYSVAVPH